MARRYDASRRREAAEKTRKEIVEAALRLHRRGITEFSALAEEAGCSQATVRRHYPTREDLFRDCTRTFGERQTFPDPAALAAIEDPEARLDAVVTGICRLHETMLGYAWLCERERDTSPVLAGELETYAGFVAVLTGVLVSPSSPAGSAARGLLHHLTYRALRLPAGLSPEETRERLVTLLRPLVSEAGDHPGSPEPTQESRP